MSAGKMSANAFGEVWKKCLKGMSRYLFQSSVADLLCSVSLKSKIGLLEFHRLIQDVRRRVEHEITFEGRERRIKYGDDLHHVYGPR